MNKKSICVLFLTLIVISLDSYAQHLNNSSMEDWYIDAYYQYPIGWTSSNDFSLPIGPAGVSADTSSYDGLYSAKIITTNIGFAGAPYAGFIVNGSMNVSGHYDIDSIYKAGEPFTETPDALSGYYKFESDAFIEDWGQAFVLLKKYDSLNQRVDTVAYGENILLNPSKEFKFFKVDINYIKEGVKPDSIVVAFFSTYPTHPISGGRLWIDNISLEYATHVDTYDKAGSLNIYPNPANNQLTIEGFIPETAKILDSSGRLLLEFKSEGVLDITSLPSGMYFLLAEHEGELMKQKFLKR